VWQFLLGLLGRNWQNKIALNCIREEIKGIMETRKPPTIRSRFSFYPFADQKHGNDHIKNNALFGAVVLFRERKGTYIRIYIYIYIYTFHRSLRLSPGNRMWNMSKTYKRYKT